MHDVSRQTLKRCRGAPRDVPSSARRPGRGDISARAVPRTGSFAADASRQHERCAGARSSCGAGDVARWSRRHVLEDRSFVAIAESREHPRTRERHEHDADQHRHPARQRSRSATRSLPVLARSGGGSVVILGLRLLVVTATRVRHERLLVVVERSYSARAREQLLRARFISVET